MSKGWIKLHRQIRENWIWQDAEKLKAWIDILMMVNHEDRQIPIDGKMLMIRHGQRWTSIKQLSERWGWSRHRVYRFLLQLKTDRMCNIESNKNGTLLTVINWDLYQLECNANGTSNGTTDGTSNGTQTRMRKNDKEGGEGPTDEELLAAMEEHIRSMNYD